MGYHLSEYVHRLRQQGYSRASIHAHLSRSGYSPFVINEVVNPYLPRVETQTVMQRWVFIVIFVVLLLLVGAFVWWMFQPLKVSLELRPSVSSVFPGNSIVFEKLLSSSNKASVDIVHELVSGSKKVVERREKLLISGLQQISSKFFVPESVKPGDYVLRVTVFFDGSSVSKQFSVVVKEPSVQDGSSLVNVTEEVGEDCATPCIAIGPCLESSCVSGACVSSPVIPCCGNGRCESDETVDSCANDCSALFSSKESVVESAVSVIKKDVSQAVLLCNSLIEDSAVDSCIETISKDAQLSSVCDAVRSHSSRDGCYMSFALEGDFSVCEKIADRYRSNSCWYLAQAKEFQSRQSV